MPIKSLRNHLRPLLRLPSHPAPSPEHFSSNPSLLHHLPSQSGPSTQSLSNSSSFFAPGTSNAGNASGAGAGRSGWGSSTGSSSGSGYTGHARAFLSLPQGDVGNSITQPGGNSTDNEQKRRLKLEAQQNTLLRHSLSKRVELVNIDEGDLGRRVHRQIEARGSSSIQLVDLEAASSIPSLDVRPSTITYPSTTQTRSVTPLPIRSANVPPRLRAIPRSQSSLEIWQLSTSPLSRSVSLRALSTRSPHQSLTEGEIDENVLDLAGESAVGLGLSSVGSLSVTPPISARVIGQPNRVLMDLAGLDLPGTQSRPFRTLGQRRNSTAATGQNYINDARAGTSNRKRAQATSPEAAAISNAIMSAARDGRVDVARDLIEYYRQDRTPSAFAAPPTSRPDLRLPQGYDTYTYNTCLSALVFFREPGQSIALLLETYNEMLERDCVPNGETFTHIIQGLAQREQDIVKATKTAEKEIKWHEWTMSKVDGDAEMATTPGDLKKRENRWQEVESYKAEGNYDTLVALLDHVEDLAPTGDLIDYRAINSIARLASERGDIPVMKRIIQLCGAHRIRGQGDRTRYLLTTLANAGDAEALRATWLKNKQSDLSSRPNQDEQRAADGSALLARRKLWTDAVIAFFIAKEPEIGYSLIKEMLESKGNSGTVAPSLNRDGIYLLVHYLAELEYPDFAHELLVASVPIVGPHTNLYRAYDALGQSYLLQDRVMDAYDFAAKYYFGVKNKDEAFNQISTFCQRLMMAILDKALVEDDPTRVEEYLNCVNLLRGSTKEVQSWYPMAKAYVNVCKKHGRLHSSVDAFGYLFASKAQARASESSTLGEEEKRQFAAFQQYVRSLVVVDESKPDDLDTSEAVALYSMMRSVSRFGRQGSACPPDPISVECANAVVSRYRQSRAQGLAHGGNADRWVFNNGRPFMQLIQIALYGRSKDVEEDADIWLLLMEDLASLSTQFISYLPHVDNTVNSLPHHFNSTMTDLSRHLVRHFGQDRSRELLSKVYPGDKVDELMAKATEVAGAQPRTSKLEVELPVTPPAMYSTLPVEESQPEAAINPTAEPTEATGFSPEDDNPFLLPFNRNKKLIIKQSLNTLMHVHTYDQPGRGGKNSPILSAYQRLRENLKQNNHVASPMSLARLVDSLSMVPGSIDKCLEVYTLAQYVIRNCCRPEEQMRHWLSVENAMLQAHCRLGFLEQAGLNRAQIINAGYAPNADSYGTMINYAKDTTDDALVARELFDESRRLGVKPTLFLYNTVISKLGKARKAEWAIELFKHMKAAGFTPTSVTYGAVINACTRVGDGESAATLFAEMESSPNFKPRVPPFNTMMQYHLTTEPSRGKVLYYFNRMAQYRVLPTEHTYKLLLDAYVSLQPVDMESMDLIFTQLQNNPKLRVQGTHWASVISAHGLYQGNVDKALEIFNSIPSHPTSRVELKTEPVVWEAILHVMANKGTMAQLEAMRERMVEMGAQTTAYVNNVLITGYAKNGAIDRARELFEDMADGEVGVAAPNNHPELRTSSGNLKPSTRTPVPTSVVYREPSTFEAMLRAELLYGDEEAARVVLARMEDRRYPVNVFMKVRALYDDHVIRTSAASSVSAASSPAELPQQTESAAIEPPIDAEGSSSPTYRPRHEHEDHQADLYHAKKPSTAQASSVDIPRVMTASPNAATYVSDLFGGHAVDESRVLSPN